MKKTDNAKVLAWQSQMSHEWHRIDRRDLNQWHLVGGHQLPQKSRVGRIRGLIIEAEKLGWKVRLVRYFDTWEYLKSIDPLVAYKTYATDGMFI